MNPLAAAPLILPLLATILCLLAWRAPFIQRLVSVASSVALTVLGLFLMRSTADGAVLVLQVSAWIAPFGITLAIDQLSAFFALATGAVSLIALTYSFADVSPELERRGFYPLFNALLFGVNGAFCTGDLFNMYVWFEVLLMSSFVLMTIEGSKKQLRAGITYVLINLLSSTCFLIALGLLYAQLGTLNIAHLTLRVAELSSAGQAAPLIPVGMLLCVAFSIKAALFPFFFWLPGTYPTPMPAITALFAGLLTKVGVYALLRVLGMVLAPLADNFSSFLLWMALLSMGTGALGALASHSARRALAFSIISGVGLSVAGLALGSAESLGAAVFYSFQSMVVTSGLFLIVGAIRAKTGSDDLQSGSGVFISAPLLAALFLIAALSLAGVPPFPGFIGKLLVLQSALESASTLTTVVVVVSGMLSLFAVANLWSELIWKPRVAVDGTNLSKTTQPLGKARIIGLALSALAFLTLVINSNDLVTRALATGAALVEPKQYISAVLPFGAPSARQVRDAANNPTGRIYIHKE